MLLHDIYTALHKREEHNFESEANRLYYTITYENNQAVIYEVEEYHFDGDEWGEIDVKRGKIKIETFNVPIEEFVNAVIMFANNMADDNGKAIMEYEYPYVSHGVFFEIINVG